MKFLAALAALASAAGIFSILVVNRTLWFDLSPVHANFWIVLYSLVSDGVNLIGYILFLRGKRSSLYLLGTTFLFTFLLTLRLSRESLPVYLFYQLPFLLPPFVILTAAAASFDSMA